MTLAGRMGRVAGSPIMELLKATAGGGYISFASGLPDPRLFPADALRGIADDVLRTDSTAALQYGPAEGYQLLRERVAETLRDRGIADATVEHVLITSGSQQALDLAARAFLDPGSQIVLESPSYLAALQIFDSYEASYIPIPIDVDGMDVGRAADAVRYGSPRLIFTLPNFQNPTGVTLASERRRKLAEIAAERQTPLLEDDAYHDLRYDGAAHAPVAALARNPNAVYTGTFSKTIVPGLRVGYLYAQPELVKRLTHLKQITDLHTGSLAQQIVYRFLTSGKFEAHVQMLRDRFRERRDALLAALSSCFSDRAVWMKPEGGMFVLARLADGTDTADLLPAAMAAGVVFVPARGFYPDKGGADAMRLNFVSEEPDRIRKGIELLAAMVSAVESAARKPATPR